MGDSLSIIPEYHSNGYLSENFMKEDFIKAPVNSSFLNLWMFRINKRS